jgi:glutamine synthetase
VSHRYPITDAASYDEEGVMRRFGVSSFVVAVMVGVGVPASRAAEEQPPAQKEIEQAQKQASDAYQQAQKA